MSSTFGKRGVANDPIVKDPPVETKSGSSDGLKRFVLIGFSCLLLVAIGLFVLTGVHQSEGTTERTTADEPAENPTSAETNPWLKTYSSDGVLLKTPQKNTNSSQSPIDEFERQRYELEVGQLVEGHNSFANMHCLKQMRGILKFKLDRLGQLAKKYDRDLPADEISGRTQVVIDVIDARLEEGSIDWAEGPSHFQNHLDERDYVHKLRSNPNADTSCKS